MVMFMFCGPGGGPRSTEHEHDMRPFHERKLNDSEKGQLLPVGSWHHDHVKIIFEMCKIKMKNNPTHF